MCEGVSGWVKGCVNERVGCMSVFGSDVEKVNAKDVRVSAAVR